MNKGGNIMEFEKKYEELELEVIRFETEDVICTSNNDGPFEPKWFVKKEICIVCGITN